jgi:hypothetical protein
MLFRVVLRRLCLPERQERRENSKIALEGLSVRLCVYVFWGDFGGFVTWRILFVRIVKKKLESCRHSISKIKATSCLNCSTDCIKKLVDQRSLQKKTRGNLHSTVRISLEINLKI